MTSVLFAVGERETLSWSTQYYFGFSATSIQIQSLPDQVVLSIMKRNVRNHARSKSKSPRALVKGWPALTLGVSSFTVTLAGLPATLALLLLEPAIALRVTQGNVYCGKTKSWVLISIGLSQSLNYLCNKSSICPASLPECLEESNTRMT